ncbi:valine--pyruvate transaminase [Motiliproteus sp. MSK22-1]|uniref:valine--pyruvate transaminase n=1 Tax=Motiliproteus sp. MSK22-1 TaxID=1897630 RepID=UPI000975B61C|nr:valine--pyruvate transaminase [Motiliproteus sp. MSK22-1]OMH28376.1 valine--pyruvate transaminase [Motiliproteus sp. MSK22-1]
MKLSSFGNKFTSESGILSLMDDLGNALAGDQDMIMMGGGNPGHIPEVETIFKQRLERITENPKEFRHLIGVYDPPQGEVEFLENLAKLLNKEFNWNISPRNIALSNGSQSGFFMLFNMFAGKFDDGSHKQIQLPLAPEYIGYADAGLSRDFFTAGHPQIDLLDEHSFKYRVDFNDISITEKTGAICVSRPTNPTGNVITDEELHKLDQLARQHQIPLLIDSAYGTPFPNLIFTEANPLWNDNCVVSMSLSKLGLPAARTGIIIANEEIINALSSINAIVNLSTGSFGAVLTQDLVRSGDIINISRDLIRPYYQQKVYQTIEWFEQAMGNQTPYFIHKPEGAMFLWLWFKDLPITSLELYERLKDRGVLVVSGHYFFPGIEEDWRHKQECIRVTYSQSEDKVRTGVEIIAEEVQRAYSHG